MSTPSAFVIGATGYTGRAVVGAWRRRGWPVTAHVRPDSPALGTWQARFSAVGAAVEAIPWDLAAFTAALGRRRPDHLFLLLGTTRARASRDERATGRPAGYEAVDYGLTALALQAARGAGITPRVTYLSALGADATSRSPYLAVRGRLEDELARSGLPYLIVRPAFISGRDRDERRPLERAASVALDAALGAARLLGLQGIQARYATLSGEQLAEGMVRLATGEPGGRMIADAAAVRDAMHRGPAQA